MSGKSGESYEKIKQWLDSPEGTAFIRKWAGYLVKEIQKLSLADKINPFFAIAEENSPIDRGERLQEACCLLLEEIAGNLSSPRTDRLAQLADRGDFSGFMLGISWNIINSLKEKNRRKESNPYGYTYRKARETFSSAHDIFTRRRDNAPSSPIWFSLLAETGFADEPCFPDEIAGFNDWQDPRQTVPDRECYPARSTRPEEERIPRFTAKQLLVLGKLFWHDSRDRLNGEYYLPVRQFVRYLSAFYHWLLPAPKPSYPDKDMKSAEPIAPVTPSSYSALPALARQLTANWTDLQQLIVYHLYFSQQNRTMAGVADELGISRYIVEKTDKETRTNIEKFCAVMLPDSFFQEDEPGTKEDFLAEINKICTQYNKDRINQVNGGKYSDEL